MDCKLDSDCGGLSHSQILKPAKALVPHPRLIFGSRRVHLAAFIGAFMGLRLAIAARYAPNC